MLFWVEVFAGPDLPPHLMSGCSDDTESEQTDLIGPKLPESESQSSSIAQQFEARSLRMKEKLNNKVSFDFFSVYTGTEFWLVTINFTCNF